MFGIDEGRWQRLLFFALTALGISSISVQLIVFREFLNVFHGNELVFGIILGNWFLLTGIGSYLGKYGRRILKKIELLILYQLIIAIIPFFSVYFIRSLRSWAMIPGEMANLGFIFLSSVIALLPYCIFSGMMLTLACSVFSKRRDEEQIGKVYFIDNIGDILGGVLFSFVFVFFLASFETLFILLLINIAAAFFLSSFIKRKFTGFFVILLLIVSSCVFFASSLDVQTGQMMFPGQNMLFQANSPYGHLVVTETAGQINFFENGIPLFSTQNTIANEETVHYAMVQHPEPDRILLISGGAAGTASEILKYDPELVDYVELDPLIIILGKAFTKNLDDGRIRMHEGDGRLFVKNRADSGGIYDVAIIDLPDPGTAQLNRFYTKEFFAELKETLDDNAVVSLSVSSSENYMNPETTMLNAIVYNTLKTRFKNIIIIPGERNIFIASDSMLSHDIVGMVNKKGIETIYVNENYLPGKLTEQRISYVSESIEKAVNGIELVNEDFLPIAYYYHLMFWLSRFEFDIVLAILIVLLTVAILLFRTSALPFTISTTAFAASSLTVVIAIGFQILFGYVYQYAGLIITSFMAGLAVGAYYMNKDIRKRGKGDMLKIEAAVAFYCLILPAVLLLLATLKGALSFVSVTLFPLLAFFMALFVGMEFPIASKLHFRKHSEKNKILKESVFGVEYTAGSLYAADLIGACAGAFLVSALLIPLIGIMNVCLLVFMINLVSLFLVWRKV